MTIDIKEKQINSDEQNKNQKIQIGPKKVIIEELHCIGCVYFHDRNIQSGNNEVHHFFCKNERITQFLSGKSIGISTKTPDWCPEINIG